MGYEPDKDLNYLEWKDAREASARFDSILVDLRKYGFTLITGLTTASSFLGFTQPDFNLLQGVIMVTMGLVVILYWLDIYYQNLLYGAVIRSVFLELFKLTQNGRRGLASFISSLHSGAGIRSFLHGVYYGFLVGLFVLGLFLATSTSSNDNQNNPTIEIKVQDGATMSLEKGYLNTISNDSSVAKNSGNSNQSIPFMWEYIGIKFPIILVATFAISLVGMIYIFVSADRRREKRWGCIRAYLNKKQFVWNPCVDLIEEAIYYVFSDGKVYKDNARKDVIKTQLQNVPECGDFSNKQ
jgi:hypothetical protein